ncbi:unnamed protein product [Prorocentrum cordatum]|uniref:Uncharacterized protein n=1 Tax=Prorocentrum cordatum TaxID=2364126 RepID=A0ABN9WF79_9DINO|nr:unnamed protein product [Polarella glacialis]
MPANDAAKCCVYPGYLTTVCRDGSSKLCSHQRQGQCIAQCTNKHSNIHYERRGCSNELFVAVDPTRHPKKTDANKRQYTEWLRPQLGRPIDGVFLLRHPALRKTIQTSEV